MFAKFDVTFGVAFGVEGCVAASRELLMPVASRVELYAAIRRDARAGISGREIERTHGVGYRTVRDALGSAWPQHRKEYSPRPSKLDPFKGAVDEILLADLKAPRKQRHTVTRIYQRLLDEQSMTGVSYPVLQRYVKVRLVNSRSPKAPNSQPKTRRRSSRDSVAAQFLTIQAFSRKCPIGHALDISFELDIEFENLTKARPARRAAARPGCHVPLGTADRCRR